MKESDVLRDCLQYLALRGCMCWRVNSGMQKAEYNGKSRVIRYGFTGASDIMGLTPTGTFLALETKYGRNTPTEAQQRFIEAVKAAGGRAAWCNETNYVEVIDQMLEVH